MRQGWTQEELSRMSGVNKPSLGMFELGKRNLPPEQINNLLSLFGADILVRLPASFAFEEKAEPVGS